MSRGAATDALRGRRVMVVEDEWLLAMEMKRLLEGAGAAVIGPLATLPRAMAALDRERPEAAVIDLNLKGEDALPLAETLRARGLPFVILTGYGRRQGPMARLPDVPHVDKPIDRAGFLRILAGVLAPG